MPSIKGVSGPITGRSRSLRLRSGGCASASAWRTIRRCTPSLRAIPFIVPPPNSYSLRICSNSSTFALLFIPSLLPHLQDAPVKWGWGRVASRIAPRGSHGSGRADFPHPALRSTASLRDRGSADSRLRQRIPLQQPFHLLHRYPCPLRAAAQPLSPRTDDTDREVVKRLVVSGDTEVPKVPQQLPLECGPLVANRFVPIAPTPIRDALERAPEPIRGGLLLHHPVSLAGLGPVVGEAQQVEGPRP